MRTLIRFALLPIAVTSLSACEQARDRGADMAACRIELNNRPQSKEFFENDDMRVLVEETAIASFLVDCMRTKGWEFTTSQCRVRRATGDAADRAAAAAGYAAQAMSDGCYRKAAKYE